MDAKLIVEKQVQQIREDLEIFRKDNQQLNKLV